MSRPVVKFGATGDDVATLHQLLAEDGFPCVEVSELSPPAFGPGTLASVKLFQACNVGPDGGHLAPDGVVGPRTWWSLDYCGRDDLTSPASTRVPPDMPAQEASNPVAAAALESAWDEVRRGVWEVPNGSNRGPRVDLYTGFEGRAPEGKGPPWCAYFASWNFSRAPGGSPFGRKGSAQGIVEYCRNLFPGSVVDLTETGLLARADDSGPEVRTAPLVQAGDLGVVDTGGGHGHVFQVAAARGGTAWTVEGNSGNAVRARKRLVSSARWYVNFDRYARERGL